MRRKIPRPVIFLDRDGTIIHDRPGHYLSRPEDLRVYKRAPEALRLLRRAGYRLVVISNQSGLGRGFLDRPTLARIHRKLAKDLKARGARLDAIYFCPHHPGDRCRCRKPKPFMARKAVRELGLTLRGAAIVGDKRADVDLGRALGIRSVFLKCGHGREQRLRHGPALKPDHVARDLLAAARWLLKSNTGVP